VRNFFGSPGGSVSSSSKVSRKERLEQAKQAAAAEKSRRRNFGFLNTGEKRMSNSSLSRTREHAKQLAMAYNEPETPTSMFSQQPMIGFQDDAPFDPFGTLTTTKTAPKANLQQTRAAGSFLDQHFEREFTASTQDSFETASVGSAYDMDFLPATASSRNHHTTPKKNNKRTQRTTLDQFVESDIMSPKSSSGSLGLETRSRNGERSVISMPTFPTNSSMQSSFARQSSSGSNNSKSGAAARRRMRSQMRQHSSNSSVSSTTSETSSFCSTPPESPSSSVRNNPKNRVAAYQRGGASSFYSQTSSTNSQSGHSGSDNIFDPGNDGGFTFDAFGLDQSQVERDVDKAMQDLAGQGISGFSMFLNDEIEEDFAPDNWDSPAGSRQASPAPIEEEGFVDGFRVTRSQSSLQEASPAASERSMASPASRRLMKSHASQPTPPRWGGTESEDRRLSTQPTIFDEPVNPWKEDPWGSDPEDKDFSSDVGADSDFGGTKSEIVQSSFQPVQRYSDSLSDIGVQSNQFQKSVSFHSNVRLPQDQFPDENDDDEMQEHLAQEFAEDFVSRISPSHSQKADVHGSVDYGYRADNYGPSHDARGDENEFARQPFPVEDSLDRERLDFHQNDRRLTDFSAVNFDHKEDFDPNFGAFGAASATKPRASASGAHSAASRFGDQRNNMHGESSQPEPAAASAQEGQQPYGYSSRPSQSPNQAQMPSFESPAANLQSFSSPEPTKHVPSDYGPVRSHLQSSAAPVEREALPERTTKSKFASFRSMYEQSRDSNPPTTERPVQTPLAPNDYGPAKGRNASYQSPRHDDNRQHSHYEKQYEGRHPQPQEDPLSPQNEDSEDLKSQEIVSPVHGRGESTAPRSTYGTLRNSYSAAKTRFGSSQADEVDVTETIGSQPTGSRSASFRERYETVSPPDDVKEVGHSGRLYQETVDESTSECDGDDDGDTQPTSSFGRSEEKKDDDDSAGNPSSVGKIGSLKAKWRQWESKPATEAPQRRPLPLKTSNEETIKKEGTVAGIGNSLGVEILTPDIVEARRQEKRRLRAEELRRASQEPALPSPKNLRKVPEKQISASEERLNECMDQRSSFTSLRERLKPSSTRLDVKSKSESGMEYRSGLASKVVDRLRQESPNRETNSSVRDTQSDAGSTPSFLANVKLRKIDASKRAEAEPSDDAGDASSSVDEDLRQSEQPTSQPRVDAVSKPEPDTPVKKLTYRERRELELKRQQEEKSKLEALKGKEPPKKDVAALIRKRIAANKQKTPGTNKAEGTDETPVPDIRGRLKPVTRVVPSPLSSPVAGTGDTPKVDESGLSIPSPRPTTEDNPDASFRSTATSPRNGHDHFKRISPPKAQKLTSRQEVVSHHQPLTSPGPRVVTDVYAEELGDQLLHDVLSPSSVGTDMEYSTDNSHSIASNGGSSRHGRKVLAEAMSPQGHEAEKIVSASASPRFGSPRKVASPEQTECQPASTTAQVSSDLSQSGSPKVTTQNNPAGDDSKKDVKSMLSNFLGGRNIPSSLPAPSKEDDVQALLRSKNKTDIKPMSPEKHNEEIEPTPPPPPPPAALNTGGRPALKDDPKYERYFRMLKVGMPMEVVKHAMQKDGNDPSVMDGDHNKPVGLPLKEDPKYSKYFKMLKLGVSINQVKHSMQMDGLMPEVMDQDHNLPAISCEQRSKSEPKEKPTHRRARLHWKTHQKVQRNSLWAKLDTEISDLDIDEEEFNELFQADLKPTMKSPSAALGANRKKGAAVRVIDAKRANNGGIILARVKMTHDEMADAVDRIDGDALSTEQIQNIIEFLPTKEEREQLEKYMLEGDEDAAEKFDGLCECEKFMVSMMTVKHAKRKVRALLFRLQFYSCLESIAEDARLVDSACEELRNSNRLRQLLGIVLQFGNRLNTAGAATKRKAGAFSLDSLLKLNQAKAFDKKTTFLHYIVLIVQRNNDLLLNFADDLPTVAKADKIYWDQCLSDLEEVENQLENVRRISLHEARNRKQRTHDSKNQGGDDDSLGEMDMTLEEEVEALRSTRTGLFTLGAIKQVSALRDQVEVTGKKFMKLLTYFGEDDKKMLPHELLNIFSVFSRDFNKAKEEVFANVKKRLREERKKTRNQPTNAKNGKPPTGPAHSSKPLRVSSFQPNMSKVLKDFQNSSVDQQQTPLRQKVADKTENATNGGHMDPGRYHSKGAGFLDPTNSQNEQKVPNGLNKVRMPMREAPSQYAPRPDVPEEPVPQGMQESGRFEELSVPEEMDPRHEASSTRLDLAKDNIRLKARRQMSGRATPVVSNTSLGRRPPGAARTPDPKTYTTYEPDHSRRPPAAYANQNTHPVPPRSSPPKISSRHMMRHRRRMEAQRQASAPSTTGPTNVAAN